MQSYNHSPWNPSQVYGDPSQPRASDRYLGHRQQTAPTPQYRMPTPPFPLPQGQPTEPPPLPPLPPSLTPGGRDRGKSTSNTTSNLFFEQQYDYGFPRRNSDESLNLTHSFYSNGIQRHTQSFTAGAQRQQPPPPPRKPVELQQLLSLPPPLPPKQFEEKPSYPSVPTLPPKISLYSRSIPGPISFPLPPEKPPQVSIPASDGDKDLEMAMLLSEAAANERKQDVYDQQEEEDLARALEESRISAFQTSSATSSPIAVEVIKPNNVASWDSGASTPSHVRSHPTSLMPGPVDLNDRNTTDSITMDDECSSPLTAQLSNDETFARRIDEPESAEEPKSSSQENVHAQSLYSDAVSRIVNSPGRSSSGSASVDHPSLQLEYNLESPLSRDNSIRSASSQHSARSDPRPSSANPGPLHSSPPVSRPATADSSGLSAAWPSAASEKRSLSMMTPKSTTPLSDSAPSINANQFVEQELLLGISLGFGPAVISTMLEPMLGTMPNIIALPYGKCPPLHLQAPSWRHLLKLMARLSGTRIEPTLEAMAVANGDLKLRTVVQFVKVHHSARDWRMLLYLTIDHPVPANPQNAWKFTNGDVCTLPYSYTLSPLPALLRDGADSAISTYYVIPSTPKTPYPTLPINFPDMAMYLQSALQDSRRALHDSSSGLRKLAKCVDSYYQHEPEFVGVEEAPEKRSFGGVFKKVIGFGNRQGKGNRGGNEDVYEFITPFVQED